MSPVDEGLYHSLMKPRRDAWRARALASKGETVVVYALRRAEALERPFWRKLETCGTRGARVKCGCRGWRGFRPYTCRQPLVCGTCGRDRAKRMGARMRAGLETALQPAPGWRPSRIVLLTITLRHSGDIARDRADLADGWRRFRKALWKRYGWFPFVGVWEVTPGSDGLGHVHGHVAVVWPWRDWGEVRELWLASCPQSERITFVARRKDGRESTAKSVANYLGKYLSKGSQDGGMTPQMLSRVLAGTYNTRWVFTSRGFWQIFVPTCQACGEPIISAQYRWHGNPTVVDWGGLDSERGPPQCCLALPEPHQRSGGRCP